jgi:hypothetical protein
MFMVGWHRLRRAASVLYFCALAGVVVFIAAGGDDDLWLEPEANASAVYLEFDSMQRLHGVGSSEHCQLYEFCTNVVIYESDACKEQIQIDINWWNIEEEWLAGATNVIDSPDAAGSAFVEVGLDSVADIDVSAIEYFEVFEVFCTKDQLTGQAKL